MPWALRRRRLLLVIAASLTLGACSTGDTAGTTAPESIATTTGIAATQAPPTQVTTTMTTVPPSTEGVTTTVPSQDLAVLCDAFLSFLGARGPEGRVAPLDIIWAERGPDSPSDLEAALETLKTADYGTEDVRAQHAVLRGFVMPRCEADYSEGVVGAADDLTAAEQFFAALVAGDKLTARTLAAAHTVAPFEPWEPYPDLGDVPELIIQEGQFFMTLTPELSLRCEMNSGIVTGCFFG